MDNMEIRTYRYVDREATAVMVTFEDALCRSDAMLTAVLRDIAAKVADKYVAENYQQIVANINPEAIATLCVAESAAAVNKTLKEKIPDKVLEVVKKEVWQRGILGGMTKIR